MRSVIATAVVGLLSFGALLACGGGGRQSFGGSIGELQAGSSSPSARATSAPLSVASASAVATASPIPSPSPSATAVPSASAAATTSAPTPAPTEAPTEAPTAAPTVAATQAPTATPTPTPTPTPSPTPSPSPSPSAASGGWPPLGPLAPQSGTLPITGTVRHANGSPAVAYCIILSAGPCNVTTDANGYFATYFLPGFAIDLFVKAWPTSPGGDGPVVYQKSVKAGDTGIAITVP